MQLLPHSEADLPSCQTTYFYPTNNLQSVFNDRWPVNNVKNQLQEFLFK